MDAVLCQRCRERDARISQLEARVAELEARHQDQTRLILDLARKLQDSDLPKGSANITETKASKPRTKNTSGRKPGGQPGHPPHLKELLPPERVTAVVPIMPTHCTG